jgi:hypothetical protein
VSSNLPPVIDLITNVVAAPGSTVQFQAHASDPNGDALTFSLDSSAPAGAQITTNGLFRWRLARALAETATPINIIVTDNGVPPLIANRIFTVNVQDFLNIALGSTNIESGQSGSVPVYLTSSSGVTNLSFTVQVFHNILTNLSVTAIAPQLASATLQDHTSNIVLTFVTLPGQMLQGTQLVSQLNFTDAGLNHVSDTVPLPIVNPAAFKPGGAAFTNYFTQAGSVVIVQDQPLLQSMISSNERSLLLFGRLGTNYELQFTTTLAAPNWQPLMDYTQTNGVQSINVDSNSPVIYYRLQQK